MTALRLGAGYFAIAFAIAFVLGVLRTLNMAPVLGEITVVLVELPVMLAAAWATCGKLPRKQRLSAAQALAMGATAFVLQMKGKLAAYQGPSAGAFLQRNFARC